MYPYTLGFPLLMVAAAVDAGVMSQLRFLNGQPSLMLILIVSWALLNDLPDAMPWAIIGGIFADVLSVTPIGASSLAFVLVTLAVSNIFGRVSRRNIILPPLAILIGTILYHGIIWLILLGVGYSVPPLGTALRWTLPTLVFNFVGIIPLFRLFGAIVEFFRPPTVPV
jgi:rod shape-determining protein MreD